MRLSAVLGNNKHRLHSGNESCSQAPGAGTAGIPAAESPAGISAEKMNGIVAPPHAYRYSLMQDSTKSSASGNLTSLQGSRGIAIDQDDNSESGFR
jgi:hypothetical protein